jgi:hypothetical protein
MEETVTEAEPAEPEESGELRAKEAEELIEARPSEARD